MSWDTSFDISLNHRNMQIGTSSSDIRYLFDLDTNVEDTQIKDMVLMLQKGCSKEGLPKPVPYNNNLTYKLVGYDELLRKELRSKKRQFSHSTLGEVKNIKEVIINYTYFEEKGIAPITIIDGEGREWSIVLDKKDIL